MILVINQCEASVADSSEWRGGGRTVYSVEKSFPMSGAVNYPLEGLGFIPWSVGWKPFSVRSIATDGQEDKNYREPLVQHSVQHRIQEMLHVGEYACILGITTYLHRP